MRSKQIALRPSIASQRWIVGVVVGLLLAGCTGPSGSAGPQAWIDAPQHDSSHPVAPMEIVLHAADPGGVAEVEVSVDGEVLARRPPDDTTAPLVVLKVNWDPLYAGDFVLTARVQNHNGDWGATTSSAVTLVGLPPAEALGSPAVVVPSRTPRPLLPTRAPTPRRAATTAALPTWTPTPGCIDKAKFVADVNFPDNTQVTPGQPFTKIWRLRNDGTCTWNESYKVVFIGGDSMANTIPPAIPAAVPPGGTVDLAVDMVAPSASGTYRGDFQIRDPQGVHFGVGASGQTPFYVQIVVGQSAPPRPTSPPAPDTQPPSVSVSLSPAGGSIPTGSTITFNANASDNVGVTRIDIWVTAPGQFPVLVKTCNSSTGCSFTGGPYTTQGNLSYFAVAADAAGNETNSGAGSILIYVVIS